MNCKILLATLLLLLVSTLGFGQYDTLRVQVLFDLGKTTIRPDGEIGLQAAMASFKPMNLSHIHLTGRTDNVGDPAANEQLARLRCVSVQAYLATQGFVRSELFTVEAHGEDQPLADNTTPAGRQKNRCVSVDFVVRAENPMRFPAEPIVRNTIANETASVVLPVPIPIDPDPNCEQDTVITLPQGTRIVFNRCEYLKLKPCLDFEEALTRPEVLANDLTTMDADGMPIVSCGMVKITLRDGCAESPCFMHPIKVRTPVPDNLECMVCKSGVPTLWAIEGRAAWGLPKGEKPEIKIVIVGGQQYYEYVLRCPGSWMNCDCRASRNQVKFKAPHGYTFVDARISFDCPLVVVKGFPRPEGRTNRVKMMVPCPRTEPYYQAVIVSDGGDTLRISSQPLAKLRGHGPHRHCDGKKKGKHIRKWLGIVPIYQHKLYRRYWVVKRPKGK